MNEIVILVNKYIFNSPNIAVHGNVVVRVRVRVRVSVSLSTKCIHRTLLIFHISI